VLAGGVYDLLDEVELGVYELLDRAELVDTPLVVRLAEFDVFDVKVRPDELDVFEVFDELDDARELDDELSLYTCRFPLLGLLYTWVLRL
jgi:hypothetical protein